MVEISEVLNKKEADALKDAKAVGIDIGSRATKGVLLYEGKLYSTLVPSSVSSKETAAQILDDLIGQAGIKYKDVEYLVGTGYGRVALEFKDIPSQVVTEISCHAMGAHYLNPDTRTILDIGGQDSKAIKVDALTGKVVEFIMNDKCAAGTGRFLEKVALLLELDLDEFGQAAVKSENPADISSQCVVFAESEVISYKAQGIPREDIAAGIHLATARRVKNLLKKVGLDDTILFTGGVSQNPGMRKAVKEVLGMELGNTKLDATLAGALGAAIYAYDYAKKIRLSYGGGL